MENITIRAEDLRKIKVFVATPMYGGNCHGLFTKSCLELQNVLNSYGVENKFSFMFNESLITRARNYLTDEFLRSGYTHLLFIDSDIDFNPMDVMTLLALDKDIIGGPYPKKSINWGAVWNASKNLLKNPNFDESKFNPTELAGVTGEYVFNPVPGTKKFDIDEPLEVMEIGTGFMMVKRKVFEVFKEEYPHLNYRPDHQGQENYDGSRYIHAFFDTVIDPDSHRYLSEDYMFCVSRNTKLETEHGEMTIGKIVDAKYSGKVKSMSKNGEVRWNNVVGWSKRKNKDKQWIKLISTSHNNKKGNLICTTDHKVAAFDDIFNPVLTYISANESVGKFMFRRKTNYENPLYNSEQLQALFGTLIGDGHISKSNQLSFTHCFEQRNYHQHKIDLFGGKIKEVLNRGFGKDHLSTNSYFPVNEQLRQLRNIVYKNNRKTLSGIIDKFTPISFAYLYMDDGGLTGKSAGISLGNLDISDCNLLVDRLKNTFGIDSKIHMKKVNYKNEIREYRSLFFDVQNTEKFFDLIGKHVHPEMTYKMWKSYDYVPLNNKHLDFSAEQIARLEKLDNHQSMLYDIEVENDHNFFASGTLIHNCQYWRAIGGKIWLCPWMRTKHIGTYPFEGDLPKIAALISAL